MGLAHSNTRTKVTIVEAAQEPVCGKAKRAFISENEEKTTENYKASCFVK